MSFEGNFSWRIHLKKVRGGFKLCFMYATATYSYHDKDNDDDVDDVRRI